MIFFNFIWEPIKQQYDNYLINCIGWKPKKNAIGSGKKNIRSVREAMYICFIWNHFNLLLLNVCIVYTSTFQLYMYCVVYDFQLYCMLLPQQQLLLHSLCSVWRRSEAKRFHIKHTLFLERVVCSHFQSWSLGKHVKCGRFNTRITSSHQSSHLT